MKKKQYTAPVTLFATMETPSICKASQINPSGNEDENIPNNNEGGEDGYVGAKPHAYSVWDCEDDY